MLLNKNFKKFYEFYEFLIFNEVYELPQNLYELPIIPQNLPHIFLWITINILLLITPDLFSSMLNKKILLLLNFQML